MRCMRVVLVIWCAVSMFAQETPPSAQQPASTEQAQPSQAQPSQAQPQQQPEEQGPAKEPNGSEESPKDQSSAVAKKKEAGPRGEAWEILARGAENKSADRRMKSIGVLGLVPNNLRARRLAEAALQDGESNVRIAAANALGEMNSRPSIPLLKHRLTDDDTGVVLACAKALLQMKDNAGYEVYYAVLTGERKANGSLLSKQMKLLHDPRKLAQIGIEEGIGFIPFAGMGYTAYRMLSKDEVSPVRAAAARALANDPDPESATALTNAVSDKSWIVRKAALDSIAKRNDPKLLKPVIPAMDDDKDIVMYTAAAVVVHLTDPTASHRKAGNKRR